VSLHTTLVETFKTLKPDHFKRHDSPRLYPKPLQEPAQISKHDEKVLRRVEKQVKREENSVKAEKLNPNNPKFHM
jgi:hypothetical protein